MRSTTLMKNTFECKDGRSEKQGQASPTSESWARADGWERISEDVIKDDDNARHLQNIGYHGDRCQQFEVANPIEKNERNSKEAHINTNIPS